MVMEVLTTIAGIVEKVKETIPAFTKDYDVLKKTVEKIRESTFQLGPEEQENLKKISDTIYAVEEVRVKSRMLVGSISAFTEATLADLHEFKTRKRRGRPLKKIMADYVSDSEAIIPKLEISIEKILRAEQSVEEVTGIVKQSIACYDNICRNADGASTKEISDSRKVAYLKISAAAPLVAELLETITTGSFAMLGTIAITSLLGLYTERCHIPEIKGKYDQLIKDAKERMKHYKKLVSRLKNMHEALSTDMDRLIKITRENEVANKGTRRKLDSSFIIDKLKEIERMCQEYLKIQSEDVDDQENEAQDSGNDKDENRKDSGGNTSPQRKKRKNVPSSKKNKEERQKGTSSKNTKKNIKKRKTC